MVAKRPFVPLWRHPEPIERGLLDFFLGGGLLRLVAAASRDAFVPSVVYYLPVAAAAGSMVIVIRASRRPEWTDEVLASFA